jgi:diaminopimelate decarboxylase
VRPVVQRDIASGSDPGAPVRPVVQRDIASGSDPVSAEVSDLVGPVCESADFLALDRSVSAIAGDLLVVEHAGAYGFVMSSNYNTRPRAAEVMIDGGRMHLVRERETVADLYRLEHRLPVGG